MALSRDGIKAHLIADMTVRFPQRHGNFPETLKIASLGFPTPESRREWSKKVNQSPWYTGWFTPSEFMACVTLGKDPNSTKPNLIDLMFNTQGRPAETHALAMEFFHAAAPAPSGPKSVAKKVAKAKSAKKKPK